MHIITGFNECPKPWTVNQTDAEEELNVCAIDWDKLFITSSVIENCCENDSKVWTENIFPLT